MSFAYLIVSNPINISKIFFPMLPTPIIPIFLLSRVSPWSFGHLFFLLGCDYQLFFENKTKSYQQP